MLARRVIAISPDKAFAKRLAQALKAAGSTVESYESLDALGRGELQAALVVIHLDGELAGALPALGARLGEHGHIIAILPRSNLADSVKALQASDRVVGVLVADELSGPDLAAMVTRVLYGDIFGVEKLVPWGTRVYSSLVGDYQEKSLCIAQISEFAGNMGVRRKYREAVEQCVDEMLMNALYDAPVDASGKQIFADVPTKTRISLRMEQKAVVQYASTGDHFVVSVRDPYGTLERATVLRYLHKCLYAEQQIDRKTGGAGLGLYIMANAATMFAFNVLPGVATECICAFDLNAPKVQLKHFGFFIEKIDAAGRLVAGPSRLLPAGASYPVERRASAQSPGPSRGIIFALAAAVALVVAMVVMVAWPRLIARDTGALRITTVPPDAIVDVDGRTRGTTTGGSLTIDGVERGRAYRVAARRDGWTPADTVIEPAGEVTSVSLTLAPREAIVNLDSDPSGATVLVDGREIGKSPVSIATLPPSSEVDLVFRKTGFVDRTRRVRVPAPGNEAYVSASLLVSTDYASIRLETTPPGAEVYQNNQPLPGVTTPVEELLVEADKPQHFTFRLRGHMPATTTVRPARGARGLLVAATLAPGGGLTVQSNVEGTATVEGVPACTRRELPMLDCPLPAGKYRVRVDATRPLGRRDLDIKMSAADLVVDAKFGIVEAKEGHQLQLGSKKVRKLALEEGKRKVTVVDPSGEVAEVDVRVEAGHTVRVP